MSSIPPEKSFSQIAAQTPERSRSIPRKSFSRAPGEELRGEGPGVNGNREEPMSLPILGRMAIALSMSAAIALPTAAFAETLSIFARASSSAAAQHMIDLWNSSHDDKIELTTIPDNQMVTKLATGVQSGDVPDLISFDLIFMPDFMRAGFLDRSDGRTLRRSEPGQGRPGLPRPGHLRRQALRHRLHPRRVDPALQQGPVPQGRP